MAGAGVCRRCDAVGAVKTAEVAGARGCSAAWATKVARLAVAGAGVCRRCDAVGAVKTAEVAGARGCSTAEEHVVGSTTPVRRGGAELQGRGPRKYCKGAGAAAEYCTGAEECVVGSTTPVRRGGAELQSKARGSVL